MRQFSLLLATEQETLVKGNPDQLMPLAEEKSRQAAALALAAEQRTQALAALGMGTDRAGMEAWLAGAGNSQVGEDWQALLQLAAEARRQNELNGKLIQTRLQYNQRALEALNLANSQTALYGPDGQIRAGSGRRTFGAY